MSTKYQLDKGMLVLLRDLSISPQDLLRQARLPLDLFAQPNPALSSEEYFRLWNAMTHLSKDELTFPITMMKALTAEVFSPPLFACYCSDNLNVALNRLAHYKPLVGPMRLDITQNSTRTTVGFKGLPQDMELPPSFIAMELAFLTQIARLATREHIVPEKVHVTIDLPALDDYEQYFGVRVTKDHFNGLSFTAHDAAKPFLTANQSMWEIFEPTLNTRLENLQQDSDFSERVRACLMEVLASGNYSMSDVARKLMVSSRTLQRRLKAEGTTFQKELDALREDLARHYLSTSEYSSGEIAFLLGYQDPNSFFRAFRSWTGMTPEVMRGDLNNASL